MTTTDDFHHCEALNHQMAYCRGRPAHIVPVPDGLTFVCDDHLAGREPLPVLRDQRVESYCLVMPLRDEWLAART